MSARIGEREAWALKQREEQAALICERADAQAVYHLEFCLESLERGSEAACRSPSVREDARQLAARLIKNDGIFRAIIVGGFALGDGLRFASLVLDTSPATLRRNYGSQLKWLRKRGEELAAVVRQLGLRFIANSPTPAKPRNVVNDDGNAWGEQTTWQQRHAAKKD